ncbi:hypothetical protein EV356DRAFT_506250 [Viridothelium virens]|uniref:Mid2 domain-containing protein n=1 Tax=Viridothelium virens TaxID=1048519 RepID=A0A6A6H1Z4_VIRVR|nr:hypothetical protein EV356DRAFT_506250 [Viridothelium virens]
MRNSASCLVLVAHFLATDVQANCYWPNGTDRNAGLPSPDYFPCNSGEVSMCCAQWDLCRNDGLCQATNSVVWRESCTDATWGSPYCLQLCTQGTDDQDQSMSANDEMLTQCPDGSWCCGQNSGAQDCCNQGQGLWIESGVVTDARPSITSPTPKSPSNSPMRSTSTSALSQPLSISSVEGSSSTPSPIMSTPVASVVSNVAPRSHDTSVIIAIVMGVLIGTILIVGGLVGFFWMWRKRLRQQKEISIEEQNPALLPELDASRRRGELSEMSENPKFDRLQLCTSGSTERSVTILELDGRAKSPPVEIGGPGK